MGLRSVIVPRETVTQTHECLQEAGRAGSEAFVLWAARVENHLSWVRSAVIPRQVSLKTESGLCVLIGPEELHRINVWLYETGLTVVAQVHSHPGSAYHSDTDSALPIATTVGSLSIVVPNFSSRPFSVTRCAVYRLLPDIGWTLLSRKQAESLIRISTQGS